MRRLFQFALAALLAGLMAAQIPKGDQQAKPGKQSTTVPDVPVGAAPTDHRSEPAAGKSAAQDGPKSDNASADEPKCHVQRADTETGFIVVCE